MSLPTRIKMGIRDSWDNPDSDVQKAIAKLKSTLGVSIHVTPQWQLLWTDLQPTYQDMGIFVPNLASVVYCWCTSLEALLDKGDNEEWTEEVLEKLGTTHGLNMLLEVDNKSKRPTTRWTNEKRSFQICVPRSQLPSTSLIIAGFNDDFLSCFKPKSNNLPHHASASGPPPGDDWADVEVDTATGQATAIDNTSSSQYSAPMPAKLDYLPSVDSLPRPEDLLLKPPYHLILAARHQSELEVQCSHGPSLQLLSDYLKKWTKQNFRDIRNPPSIEVSLEESPIGMGLLFDRLVIRPQNQHQRLTQTLSPVVVLSFVEGVLGFEMVHAEGGCWHYKRLGELKKF